MPGTGSVRRAKFSSLTWFMVLRPPASSQGCTPSNLSPFSESLPVPSNRCSSTTGKVSLCKSQYHGFNHLTQSVCELGL